MAGRSRSNTNPFANLVDNGTTDSGHTGSAVGASPIASRDRSDTKNNPFFIDASGNNNSEQSGAGPAVDPETKLVSSGLGGEAGEEDDVVEIDTGVFAFAENGKPLEATHVAAFAYASKEVDECSLTPGDLVHVAEEGMDGWFVGKNLTTNQLGTFPGNFIYPMEEGQRCGLVPPLTLAGYTSGSSLMSAADVMSNSTSVSNSPGHDVTVQLVNQLTADELLARKLQQEEDQALASQLGGMSVTGVGPASMSNPIPIARPQASAPIPYHLRPQPPIALRKTPVVIPRHVPAKDKNKKMKKKLSFTTFMKDFDEDYEKYMLRFLGSQRVLVPTAKGIIKQIIEKVLLERKQMKINTSSLFEMRIYAKGIELIDLGTTKKKNPNALKKAAQAEHRAGGPVTEYALQNICVCEYNVKDPKLFGFISKHHGSHAVQYACHIFMYDKSTVPIVNALARAFDQQVVGQDSNLIHN